MKYFPDDEKEFKKMSRKYICDIIHSVIGEPFTSWVKNMIDERNEARKLKNEMNIALDPEILEIFNKSTTVSLTKGISNHSK